MCIISYVRNIINHHWAQQLIIFKSCEEHDRAGINKKEREKLRSWEEKERMEKGRGARDGRPFVSQ